MSPPNRFPPLAGAVRREYDPAMVTGALGRLGARVRPRSWAEVDLDALGANLAALRRLAPRGRVLAVVKADAYGHGARIVAPAASAAGAAMVGVGDSTEALELRREGVSGPIVVLGTLVTSEIPAIVAAGIVPVVHSQRRLEELEEEAARQGRVVALHLKVDTGMGRLGMQPSRVLDLARRAAASSHLVLDGLMSHLAGAGPEGRPGNRRQAEVFAGLIEDLAAAGLRPPNVHLRATSGLLDPTLEVPGETLARAGAALYGFSPAGRIPPEGLRPVLSLRTQVVFIKDVGAGVPIGYGGTFVTSRPTRLAIIPLGYHDGMKRGLANRGEALVRGGRAPVVGEVSMDYSTLDITDIPGSAVGDTVTLIGADGGLRLGIEEVAARAGTIPYDVACGLGRRVVRIPVGERASDPVSG